MPPEAEVRNKAASAMPSWLVSLAGFQPALADWANGVHESLSAGFSSSELARIAGKGLVIEGADQAEVEYALEEIASGLAMSLVQVDACQLDDFLQETETVEQPTIVNVCFGPWISKEHNDPASLYARRRLATIFDDPNDRRIFVTCTNDFLDVAVSLRRVGRFDAYLMWEESTPESSVQEFIEATVGVRIASEVTRDLERLGRVLCVRFPGRRLIGLLGIAMRRLSHRAGRAICMQDLMEFAANGTQLRSCNRKPRNERLVAVHEAGHAIAHIVASGWARIPDFISIAPTHGYLGVMIENFCDVHRTEQQTTVDEVLLQIKTKLGGRAAEISLFGVEGAAAFGAEQDLAEAHSLAHRLVAGAGIVIDAGQVRQRPWVVPPKSAVHETSEVTAAVQVLMEHCWNEVLAMMGDERSLLLRLTDALTERKHLLNHDIRAIAGGSGRYPSQTSHRLTACSGPQNDRTIRLGITRILDEPRPSDDATDCRVDDEAQIEMAASGAIVDKQWMTGVTSRSEAVCCVSES